MIDADRLVKHFRSGDGGIVRAVDDVSFTVAGGEMVGLLGANGVGKTTTMRMLATLLKPTSGTARIAGHDIVREPLAVRRRLGYLSATTGVPDRRPCGRLSTGQRQRVSLGRALIHDPPALVLDEPTSGLDVRGARDLLEHLERLRGDGRAVLISTHRLHEIERRCDRFLIIDAGRIVAAGTRDELAGSEGSLEDAFFAAIDGRPSA